MNREALNAVVEDGRLPMDFVKNHHEIWYQKLTRENTDSSYIEKKIVIERK